MACPSVVTALTRMPGKGTGEKPVSLEQLLLLRVEDHAHEQLPRVFQREDLQLEGYPLHVTNVHLTTPLVSTVSLMVPMVHIVTYGSH